MSTQKAKVRFNYGDYCLLPEDKQYDLIDGELYMAPAPSLRHQAVLRNLELLIWTFVKENNLGQVFFAPVDVILSEEDVVQPDLLFVVQERLGILTERGCEGPPDLVVEVLSPTTEQRDRELKRKVYAKFGVSEYWLVDPEVQSIEVMVLEAEDFSSPDIYLREGSIVSRIIPQLSLAVSQVFPVE